MEKRRLAITIMLVFSAILCGYSQNIDSLKKEPTNFQQYMRKNWFISAGAGAEKRFDSTNGLSLTATPTIDISVGKWLLPYTALRLQYNYSPIRGNSSLANSFTNQDPDGDLTGNISIIHGDLIFSIMSMVDGYYNDDRVYDLMPFIGAGASISHDKNTTYTKDYPVFGLINSFRVSDRLALNIEVRTSPANAGHYGMTVSENQRDRVVPVSASLGITYRFKSRRWIIRAPYADYPEVRVFEKNKYIPERKEVVVQKETVTVTDTVNIEKMVKEIYLSTNIIFFELDKYNISSRNRVRLSYIAKIINDIDTDQVFTITGYADEVTGSKPHNKVLSKNRAEAVYNVLVKEFKVDKRKLKIDYKGGVGDMFYDNNTLSRCAIIE